MSQFLTPADVDRVFGNLEFTLRTLRTFRAKKMAKTTTLKISKPTVASEETAAAVAKLQKVQAEMKANYGEIDRLEAHIFAALAEAKGKRLNLPDGRVVAIKDNYREKNTAFKTCAFRRLELVVV